MWITGQALVLHHPRKPLEVALAVIVYADPLLTDLTNHVIDDHIRGGKVSGISIRP